MKLFKLTTSDAYTYNNSCFAAIFPAYTEVGHISSLKNTQHGSLYL